MKSIPLALQEHHRHWRASFALGALLALGGLQPKAAAETFTLAPTEDAWVSEGLPTANFGGTTILRVATDGFLQRQLALLKFSLAGIPVGSTITRAELKLFLRHNEEPAKSLAVFDVDGDWIEGEVTWNNRPGVLPAPLAAATVGPPEGAWISWDVRTLVERWAASPGWDRRRSLAISGPAELSLKDFDSREGANPPQLLIEFTPALPDGQISVVIDQAWAFLDHDDSWAPFIGGSQQDFYLYASIDGAPPTASPILDGRDHASWTPAFTVTANVRKAQRYYLVYVELRDDDPAEDEIFDISPVAGRPLQLEFDACLLRWRIIGRPEYYGPYPETMPRRQDWGLLEDEDPGRVNLQIRTGDGRSFAPNDVAILNATPIQAVINPDVIVEGRPTVFMVQLSSSWPTVKAATISVTLNDNFHSVTDTKSVTVPPEGLKVILFDGTGSAAPFVPIRKDENPSLLFSVDVDIPGEAAVDVAPPFDKICVGANNQIDLASMKVIRTRGPAVIYVPWDWDDDRNPPAAGDVTVSAAANENFRGNIFPIASTAGAVAPSPLLTPFGPATSLVLPWLSDFISVEPGQSIAVLSAAAALAGIERQVLLTRKGWFAANYDRLDFVSPRTIGLSLGEFAPNAVIAEAGFPAVAVHELGHTYWQSQHSCAAEDVFNWNCRDEYEHTAADAAPYLGFGYDVLGTVFPAGFGPGLVGPREVNGATNFMNSEMGSLSASGVPTYGNWIDTFTWNDLCRRLQEGNDPELLVVSGLVWARNGRAAAQPGSVGFLFPGGKTTGYPDMPSPPPGVVSGGGSILLEVKTTQGDRLYRFEPRFTSVAGRGDIAFFSFTVPWETNLTGVRLKAPASYLNWQQSTNLDVFSLNRSAADPVISGLRAAADVPPNFLTPQPDPPGIRAGHSVVIGWQASDVDSPALYSTLYVAREPNDHAAPIWLPIGLQLTTNRISLAYDRLAGGPGRYRGKVIVSDGVNSRSLEVTNLFEISREATALVPAGATWRYADSGADLGTSWRTPAFSDVAWLSGPARLGFGGDGEQTALAGGHVTYYFRRPFTVTNVASLSTLQVRLKRDDGAVVYLNDTEVFRSNMPTGRISSLTFASATTSGGEETNVFLSPKLTRSVLLNGQNLIAVEVHQAGANDGDLGFDLELEATPQPEPPVIIQHPENQMVFEGDPLTLNVVAAGTPPMSYQWSRGGALIPSATNATFTIAMATTNDAGAYSVLVSNTAGSAASLSAFVTISRSCPTLICPPNITATCTEPRGAVVNYSVGAGNPCNPADFELTCQPPPGSLFPIGTTWVFCTSRAPIAGRDVQCDFPVTVTGDCGPSCILPSGLVAWWRADGNALDEVGDHHGSLHGSTAFPPGKVGQAFSFDGSDENYVSVPNSPDWELGPAFTIEMWVQLHEIKRSMFIHHESGLGASGFELDLQPGLGLVFARNQSAGFVRGWSPTPEIDVWYHLAVTRQADGYRLFVNGIQMGEPDPSSDPVTPKSGPLRIGSYGGQSGYGVNGLIDEVSIYHRALSAAELRSIFNAGQAGKCPPPSCLKIELESPLACKTGPYISITGQVLGCNPVTRIEWFASGGPTNLLCGTCGGNPSFTFGVPNLGQCFSQTFTFTARDSLGNIATKTYTIPADRIAPVLHCPGNLSVSCAETNGAAVTYNVSATDNCDPHPSVTCAPPSGSVFPLGDTIVHCVTADACGNTNECRFTVTVASCCVKPPSDLVLWLPLDERSGNVAYNRVAPYHGVIKEGYYPAEPGAGPAHQTGEYVGNSLHFDGRNDECCFDWVRVPYYTDLDVGTGDFSVDAWISMDPANFANRMILSKANSVAPGESRGFLFGTYYGRLMVRVYHDGIMTDHVDTQLIPADSSWHFVAVTIRRGLPNGLQFYVDGRPTGTSDPTVHPRTLSSEGPVAIGGDKSRNWQWAGNIDEVEMFRRALEPAEILSLYNARDQGKCRFTATLPRDTGFCPDEPVVGVSAEICNPTSEAHQISYTLQGLPIGPGFTFSGETAVFNPGSGVLNVPPHSCIAVPLTILKPAGMPCGAAAGYQLTCRSDSGEIFVAIGTLIGHCDLCVGVPAATIDLGSLIPLAIAPFNVLNPGALPIDLSGAKIVVYGPDGTLDTNTVSLNGQMPGTPVILPAGTIVPPGGGLGGLWPAFAGAPPGALPGSLTLSVNVTFVRFQPGQAFTLVLEADRNGDQIADPLSSMKLRNVVTPPQPVTLTIARGANGSVTLAWPSEDWLLESAPAINGPFTAVPGALSGYAVPSSLNNTRFYRLKLP